MDRENSLYRKSSNLSIFFVIQRVFVIRTILQRNTVGVGRMKIQGVATCQYLCMDSCGLLYGSREFGDECVFNETIEVHYYNTYSSTKYSNERRTLYLALNRRGQPRKVMLKTGQKLGRLSSYTRVLTRTVAPERVEEFQLHPMRHHAHMCSPSPEGRSRLPLPTADRPAESPRCRRRKKRKKKKRKCPPDVDPDSEMCHKRQSASAPNHRKQQQNRLVKKCENEDSDECQRDVRKKLKTNNPSDNKLLTTSVPKKKKLKKNAKKRLQVITSTEPSVTTQLTEEVTQDEDYGLEATTHWDWEDPTAVPDMSMSISIPMPSAHAHTSAQPD